MYGHRLDIFTSIQSFMTVGIPGSRIDLVMPPLGYEVSPSCLIDCLGSLGVILKLNIMKQLVEVFVHLRTVEEHKVSVVK